MRNMNQFTVIEDGNEGFGYRLRFLWIFSVEFVYIKLKTSHISLGFKVEHVGITFTLHT